MDTLPEKTKRKRASQGKRKHIRRMKQEARKASILGDEVKRRKRTS